MKVYIVFDRAGFIVAIFADKEKMLASDAIRDAFDKDIGAGIDGYFWEEHNVVQ
jgi:hypothetical protein